jgi:hypothetical protein
MATSIVPWTLIESVTWTIQTSVSGVGLNRWSLTLRGHRNLTDFPGDQPNGNTAYRRAARTHANYVENSFGYAALARVISYIVLTSPTIETLALVFMGARV